MCARGARSQLPTLGPHRPGESFSSAWLTPPRGGIHIRTTTTLLVLASLLTAATPLVVANHLCEGGEVLAVGAAGTNVAYYTTDHTSTGYEMHFVYLESNGMSGLQRGGSDVLGDRDHACQDGTPDTFVIVYGEL